MDKKQKKCRNCGKILPFEDVCCPYCGAEVEKQHRKKWWIWVLAGILLLDALLNFRDGIQTLSLFEWEDSDFFADISALFSGDAEYPEHSYEYYTVSPEEWEDLDADALWRQPEQWTQVTPGLTETQLEAMERLAERMEYAEDSRASAIDFLTDAGYSREDAQAAADGLQIDWNVQAVKSALEYLSFSSFSRKELQSQLIFEGFTTGQAAYGADNCGADWQEQADLSARECVDYGSFSRTALIQRLEERGYSRKMAIHGVDAADVDWMEQAVRSAEEYLELGDFTWEEMVDQLLYEGFTREEAQYAADELDLD